MIRFFVGAWYFSVYKAQHRLSLTWRDAMGVVIPRKSPSKK